MVLRCTLLIALAAGAFAVPVMRRGPDCAVSTCPDNNGKFKMETGSTYEYDYSSDVKTMMLGASEEHSSLHMTASVHIEVLQPCEMALKMTDVILRDSDPSDIDMRSEVPNMRVFKQKLEERPLRFAWIDGKIEHICPHDDDVTEPWVLNIKRGVLSGMQNTMPVLDAPHDDSDIDISGRCPVKYSVSSGFSVDTVTKVKDMLGCIDGHTHDTIFHGVPYSVDSRIQTMPLMDSSHECQQEIRSDNGDVFISKVMCKESHMFRPFSTGSSGANTDVMTMLSFKSKRSGVTTRIGTVDMHEYLTFDSTPSQYEIEVSMRELNGLMQDYCSSMSDDVRPETPAMFMKMIQKMRKLDTAALMQLHRKSKNQCEKAEKAFHDALGNLQTKAGVNVITSLLQSGEVTGVEAEILVTSVSMIGRPTLDLLQESRMLLTLQEGIGRKAHLAVSSLVHNYCHLNEQCQQETIVENIIKGFEDNLNYNCENIDHELALMSLKALGNAGGSHNTAGILSRCMMNPQLDMELRVEAVKAFRRLQCDISRDDVMTLYRDMSMDSELRIHAYLQLMKCPSESVLMSVKEQLEGEEINQVGSFVWTHLTNIIESSDPLKVDISRLLMTDEMQRAFDMDKRKFSRNMEMSLFSHMLNMGATGESNLIFSEKSFVPRSLNLNLTMNMFGHSINMLEIGGRVEDLETLLEKIFGDMQQPDQQQQQQRRGGRSLIDPADVNVLHGRYNLPRRDSPKASMYVKMFGNEIRYNDFHDLDTDALKDKYNFLDWLMRLSEEQGHEFTKNHLILDADHIVCTIAGMPLKLLGEATSTVQMKTSGRLDVRGLMASPMKLAIDGSLEPSAAVVFTSMMGVDAHVAETGLKMVETIHTSTVLSGKIEFEQGKILSVDWNQPREKMEVFNFKSKFYVTHRDMDREQRMRVDSVWQRDECADMSKAIGMEFCAKAYVPMATSRDAPLFPFTGPIDVDVYAMKTDTFDKYHMEMTFNHEQAPGAYIPTSTTATLVLDTPGSQHNRRVDFSATINYAGMYSEITLTSPWKKMVFNAELENEVAQKSMSLVAMIDDTDEYAMRLRMPVQQKRNGYQFEPELTITYPGIPSPRISGSLLFIANRKVDFSLRLRNVFSEPAKATGTLTIVNSDNRWKRELEANIQMPLVSGTFTGFIDKQGQVLSSRGELEWTGQDGQQRITVNNKLKDLGSDTITKYQLESQWTTTVMPEYAGDMTLIVGFGKMTYVFDLDTGFDNMRRMQIKNSGSLDLGSITKTAEAELKFKAPYKEMDHHYMIEHKHNKDELSTKLMGQISADHQAGAEVQLRRDSMSPLKTSSMMKLYWPGHQVQLTEELEEVRPGQEYAHKARLQLGPDYVITADSTVRVRQSSMLEIESTVQVPNMRPISVELEVRPVLRDLMIKGKTMVEGQRYTMEMTMVSEGSMADHSNRITLDVNYPQRHVTFASTYGYARGMMNGEYLLRWNADVDADEKNEFKFRLNMDRTSPLFYARMEFYPQKFIELDTSANLAGAQSMNGHVTLKSNLNDMVDMDMASEYHVEFDFRPKTDGGLLKLECHADRMKVQIDIDGMLTRNYDTHALTIDVMTPMQVFRTMKIETSHDMTPKTLNMMGAFTWDGQTVKLESENTIRWARKLYQGGLKFTSPFEGYEDLRMTASHQITDDTHVTSIEFNFGGSGPITLEQELTFIPGVKFDIDSTLTTPWSDYENMRLKCMIQKDGMTMSTSNEFMWARQQKVTLDGSFTKQPPADFDLTFSVTTPWDAMKKFALNVDNRKRGIAYVSHADVEYAPGKFMKFDSNIDVESYKKIMLKVEVPECSWIGVTSLDYVRNGEWINHDLTLTFTSSPMSVEPIVLTSVMDMRNLLDMSIDVKMTSPVGLRSMELMMTNVKNGRVYNTRCTLTLPSYTAVFTNELRAVSLQDLSCTSILNLQGDEYKLVSSVSGGNTLRISCMLHTPMRDWPKVGFELKHRGLHSDFTTEFDVTYGRAKKMTTHCTFKMDEQGLEIDAAVVGLMNKDYTLKMEHSGDFYSMMNTKIEFHYGRTAQADSMQQYFGAGYDQSLFGRMMALLDKEIDVVFKHRGNIMDFTSTLECKADSSTIKTTLQFGIRGRRFGGFLQVETPFQAVSLVKIEMKHNGVWNDFSNEAGFTLNRQAWKVVNTFEYTNRAISIESTVTTPIDGYETNTIKVTHTGSMTNFRSEAEFMIGGQEATMSMTLATGDSITATLDMMTPLEACRTLVMRLEHNSRNWRNFNSELDVTLNGRSYTGNMLFKLMQENMRLEVTATAPGKTYGLNIRHRGDIRDFDTTCVVSSPDGNVEVKVSHKKDNSGLESSLEVKTPIPGYRIMSGEVMFKGQMSDMEAGLKLRLPFRMVRILNLAAKHRGSLSDFNNEMTLTVNDDITTVKCSFVNNDAMIKGELMMNTPYAQLGEMGVEIDHKWLPTSGFTSMARIVTPMNKFQRQSVEMKYHGPLTNLEAEVKLMTSYPGYRQFMMGVTNKMMGDQMIISAKLVTPIEGYETFELTLSHTGTLSNFLTNVVIETSVQGSRRFAAELSHNMEDGIQTKVDISTPWDILKQIKVEFKHTPRADGYDVMLDVITPFEGFEEQGVTMSYTGDTDSFKADGKIEWQRRAQKIEGEVEYEMKPSKMKVKCKVMSSLRDYPEIIDMDLDHRFLESGFSSDLTLKTPLMEPLEVKVVFRGHRYDFVTDMDLKYADSQYKTECTFRYLEGDKTLVWKLLQAPWAVRSMQVKMSHQSARQANNGELALSINDNDKLDVDYSYTKQTPYNMRITARRPMPVTLTINCHTDGATTTSDMRLEYLQKVMTADMTYTTNSGWYTTDEKIVINMQLPSGRVMKLDTTMMMGDGECKHTAMLQWAAGEQATWDVTLRKTTTRGRLSYDGTLKMESPMWTGECSVSHVTIDGKQFITTLQVPGGMTLKRELVINAPTYSHMIELEHPQLRRGLKHEVTLIYDPDHCKLQLDGMLIMDGSEQNKVHMRIEDESGNRERMVYEYTLEFPIVGVSIENTMLYVNNDREFSMDHLYKQKLRSDRQMIECHGQMKFNKQTSDFTMQLKNPMATIDFTGGYETQGDMGHVYKIERVWDDAELTLRFGREQMMVFSEIMRKASRSAPVDKLRMQFERHDSQNMDFKVMHTIRQREVEDIKIAIVPRGAGIGVTTFFRQNMMLDVSSYITSIDMSRVMRSIEMFMQKSVEHVQQMKTDASDMKDMLFEKLQLAFGEQIRYLMTSYQRMLRNNDFYLNDIVSMMNVFCELMSRQVDRMLDSLGNTLQYYRSRAVRMIRASFNNLNEIVNALEARIQRFVEENLAHIQNVHAMLERVVTTLDEMVRQFNAHPLVQWYYQTLEQIRTGEFMRMMRQWKADVEQYIDDVMRHYQTQIDIMYDIWRNIERMPVMRQLTAIVSRIADFYNYLSYEYDVDGTMRMVADRLSQITWRMIKERIYDIISDVIRKWDPSNMNLELNLYMPHDFMWDVSPAIPDLQVSDSVRELYQWILDLLPSFDWSIMDYYHAYKPSSKISDMLPPFKAWATIVGSQHYVTFDKRFYAFEAECDYLLARDFIDGKFSVVVSYERDGGEMKKSVIVMDGEQQVKVMPDGQILLDGRSAELPLMMSKTVVLRDGSMVRIKNKHGLELDCDLMYDRCTVQVSGWYHGKTAGLLGTYDNEPVNDLIKNDGTRATDIDEFAQSWALKSQCRNARNVAVTQEPVPGTDTYEQCKTYFNDTDSIFSRCYKIVNPWTAMRMCVKDIGKGKDICHAASYYHSECMKREIHTHMPKECLKCKKIDGREYEGAITVQGGDVPQSADIVFVIQHADCNSDVIEQLTATVSDLDEKLIQKGLRDNLYGIVGFGSHGDLNDPHTHTMDGQLFNTQQKFVQGIQSWSGMQMGSGSPDVLKAIEFAAKYPFRTGVSKTIVVIPCDSCAEVQTSYRDVQRLLTERDIRLHVVMDHEFSMKASLNKNAQMSNYGADKYGIFTKKHVRGDDIESDRELYNLVNLPSDLCTSMSHGSNGAVFDVNQMTHSRRADQKKFTQVMVKVIANGAEPSECQQCMCVSDEACGAMSVCKSCSSNAFQFHELYPEIIKHSNNLADRLKGFRLW